MADNKEQFDLPYHSKNFMPEYGKERTLFVFMSVVIPFIFLWEIWIMYQYYDSLIPVVYTHAALQLFLFHNIVGNLYYLKKVDTTGKQKSLPAILKPGWRYCHFCELNAPPRAYHCPHCDECILKRDRHCMFSGCCVGYANQRYYFLCILYVVLAAAYMFFFQLNHYLESVGGFYFTTILTIVAPHVALVTGFLSIYGFIMTVTQIFLCLVVVFVGYLVLQQMSCIMHGQTKFENSEDIFLYDLGFYRNLVEVMGYRWHLALLSPFLASNLPGDGIYFMTSDELEEIKDV